MKYCRYCGHEIADEAVVCVHCGRAVESLTQPEQKNSGINTMCLLGFIFSFLVSVVGLILSILAYNQVKDTNDNTNKTLAKAGIIISSVAIGLVAFILVFYFIWFFLLFATIV